MPRTARCEVADGVHHVTCRGNGKQRVFIRAGDRLIFLRLLGQAVERCRWECLTYCLMDNHYHLLVRTPEPNLGDGMHRLNGRYAQGFNGRYQRTGHLWEERFHSVLLREDAHLAQTIGYIALNPVRAGLCDRPEDWPWSGHRAIAGLGADPLVSADVTLVYFSAAFGGDGRDRYLEFVTNRT
jgi:putative transposase